jgi:hypothetical protein
MPRSAFRDLGMGGVFYCLTTRISRLATPYFSGLVVFCLQSPGAACIKGHCLHFDQMILVCNPAFSAMIVQCNDNATNR